jgi:ABC-type transporter Mla subunit MlaD
VAGMTNLAESLRAVTVNGVDVGTQVGGAVDSIRASLDGVTDSAGAQAAKVKIEEAGKALDNVSAQVEQLPAEGRKLLASTISSALPTLKAGADKVAGYSPEMKPTLDAIIARLEGWAKAPA